MASLLRPYAKLWTPGQEKPQGVPRIDWKHPLAAGLIFYGFDTGSGAIVDLVRGRKQTTVGTPPGGATALGAGLHYDGASTDVYFAADAEVRSATAAPPWTCACAFIADNFSSGPVVFSRDAEDGINPPFLNWGFISGAPNAGGNFVLNSGGSFTGIGSGSTQNANTFYSVAGVALSPSSAAYYQNGVQQGSTTTGLTIQSDNVTPGDEIEFGAHGRGPADRAFAGYVFYGAFWGRALTTQELIQLHLDPYCFLLPSEGEMPALFVSSGTITEVLAATETKDVAAFVGKEIASGTLAITEAKDVAAFVGKEIASGTLAATETKDVAAFVGKEIASGVLGATETKDVAAFAGLMGAFGTLGATETKDVAAFAGREIASGVLAVTEAKDAAAFAGFLTASGTLAATEAKDLVRFGSPSRKLRGGPFFGTLGRMKEM